MVSPNAGSVGSLRPTRRRVPIIVAAAASRRVVGIEQEPTVHHVGAIGVILGVFRQERTKERSSDGP